MKGKYLMTREEFFERYKSLYKETEELRFKIRENTREYEKLLEDNAKTFLGVEEGDCIYDKTDNHWYEIVDIRVDMLNTVDDKFYLTICDMVNTEYDVCIDEEDFFKNFLTQEKYDEIQNQKKEENEYQEYLRLKEKYE